MPALRGIGSGCGVRGVAGAGEAEVLLLLGGKSVPTLHLHCTRTAQVREYHGPSPSNLTWPVSLTSLASYPIFQLKFQFPLFHSHHLTTTYHPTIQVDDNIITVIFVLKLCRLV